MGRDGSGVKKASETTIQIEFIYEGRRCRERIRSTPTTVNLRKAVRFREKILEEIEEGTFDYAGYFPNSKNLVKPIPTTDGLTVGKWLDTWLERKENHLKVSAYDGYVKVISQLKQVFGSTLLEDLKKKDVRAWCESKKVSNKTISNLVSPLRSALQEACEEDLIPMNPLTNFEFKRIEPPREDKELDPFSVAEEQAILSACAGHAQNLIKFAFWTGLRTSELVALTWEDIDLTNDRVHIRRAKTQKALKAEITKTTSGTRIIRLLPPAKDALQKQAELTRYTGSIFLNPHDDHPWKGDQPIRRLWILILRDAGVRYRRPYQTRHTFASRMLSAGEPLVWLSNHLGHSSTTLTEKVYAKYIVGTHPEAGNKGVDLFKGL